MFSVFTKKCQNPIRTIRWAGPLSLFIVAVLYVFVNIAYFAAVPKAGIIDSETAAAAIFFEAVFGEGNAGRGLSFLILVSSFGNLVSNLIGAGRIIRECGR